MKKRDSRKKSMNHSLKDAVATSVMSGTGEAYLTPFAIELQASNSQIGFLSSFVGLFGALAEIFGSSFIYKHSKKKIVTNAVIAQSTVWLIISSIGFLFWKEIISNPVTILIFLYTLAVILGSFGGPAWFSLIGDIVPKRIRGRFFSKRNKLASFVSLVSTFIAAYFLDITKEMGYVLVGFSILFLIATISRLIAAYHLNKHIEPKVDISRETHFSFFQFIKRAPKNNFGRFVIYITLINFSVAFASPFFAVYMLKELQYSYFWFTLVNISAVIFTILSLSLWGRISDKYGNKKLLEIGAIIIPISPILWIISPNPFVLILTAQLAAGIGWGAFNFATSNFIYDAVTPQRRAICVAYFTMLGGIGIFAGGILGGLFAQNVNLLFMNKFIFMFILSGILRATVSIIMLPRINEVKKVKIASKTQILLEEMRVLQSKMFFKSFKGPTQVTSGLRERVIKK